MTGLSFLDTDPDHDELGGAVKWTAPVAPAEPIMEYEVYLATDTVGTGKVLQGSIDASARHYDLAADTALADFSQIVVVSTNTAGEEPLSSAVYGLQFEDTDTTKAQIGGTVQWDPPRSTADITAFNVYLATSAAGAGSELQGAVPVGTISYARRIHARGRAHAEQRGRAREGGRSEDYRLPPAGGLGQPRRIQGHRRG